MESVTFFAGDRQIVGSIFTPDSSNLPSPPRSLPGILFVHGFKSDQSGYRSRARTASDELHAVCLTFDLSGHGHSASAVELPSLTPRNHFDDVKAAFDMLTSNTLVDPTRIGVCGASYGAYLAALLIWERQIRRLLLRAPALYSDDQFGLPHRLRRHSQADADAPMLMESMKSFGGAVLVLESGADQEISHEIIEVYLEACPRARHQVIAGAAHALTEPEWKAQFLRAILTEFRDI